MSIIINGMDMPKGNSVKNLLIYSDGRVFTGHKDDASYSAEERKTGKWINEGAYSDYTNICAWHCSECGEHIIAYPTELDPFCRHCGAKMEGEEHETD